MTSPPGSTPEVDDGMLGETKSPNGNSLWSSEDPKASLDDPTSIGEHFRNVDWSLNDTFPVRGKIDTILYVALFGVGIS